MRGLLLLCLFGIALCNENDYSWVEEPPQDTTSENACLTDTSSCSCCLMKKQIYHMEEYFNETMDEIQEKLSKAQAALNMIRSCRSAFSVALTNERKCHGPFREGAIVDYKHTFLNLDNSYINGVFTAPRSGIYNLVFTVYSDSGAKDSELKACANLRVNGVDVAKLSDMNSDDQEDSATSMLVHQLSAGDMVYVFLPAGCSLCDNDSHYNTFSGVLLYASTANS